MSKSKFLISFCNIFLISFNCHFLELFLLKKFFFVLLGEDEGIIGGIFLSFILILYLVKFLFEFLIFFMKDISLSIELFDKLCPFELNLVVELLSNPI